MYTRQASVANVMGDHEIRRPRVLLQHSNLRYNRLLGSSLCRAYVDLRVPVSVPPAPGDAEGCEGCRVILCWIQSHPHSILKSFPGALFCRSVRTALFNNTYHGGIIGRVPKSYNLLGANFLLCKLLIGVLQNGVSSIELFIAASCSLSNN